VIDSSFICRLRFNPSTCKVDLSSLATYISLKNVFRTRFINQSWLDHTQYLLVVFEGLDKYVDIAAAEAYYKGRLFYKPKESVYEALLVFTIFGGVISLIRISLYVWRIYLNYKCNGSDEKRYDDCNLGTQSIKVILEAFPQSVIAKFGFVHCPIKKYGWKIWFLDPAFDGFCGTPFIFFLCYLCYYGYKHERQHYESFGRTEWWKVCFCCTTFVRFILFITVALSVTGFVFASLSLSEFSKRCS